MNAARAWVVAILLTALVAGVAMWWLQVHAFYREEDLAQAGPVRVALRDGTAEEMAPISFRAIDSDSSPIRFRACFTVDLDLPALAQRAEAYARPTPLNAPGWFDCFDARAIDEALVAGEALAFRLEAPVAEGVDRVVAIFPQGTAYAWNQIDACGPLTPAADRPAECPAPPPIE